MTCRVMADRLCAGSTSRHFRTGAAKLVPAGSDIVLEVHYMPEGKATTDQSSVGLVFCQRAPQERVMTLSAVNETSKFLLGIQITG